MPSWGPDLVNKLISISIYIALFKKIPPIYQVKTRPCEQNLKNMKNNCDRKQMIQSKKIYSEIKPSLIIASD
jgi:hypothetical protein